MLVIQRNIGEEIIITLEDGRNVRVALSGFWRGEGEVEARIAIDAPRDVQIWRGEIYEQRTGKPIPARDTDGTDGHGGVDPGRLRRFADGSDGGPWGPKPKPKRRIRTFADYRHASRRIDIDEEDDADE